MSFKNELTSLVKNHKSPKLDAVKEHLKNEAAKGKTSATIDENKYDKYVIEWLESQGITCKVSGHQRDGYYLFVSWQ